jgi:hypothetical protein
LSYTGKREYVFELWFLYSVLTAFTGEGHHLEFAMGVINKNFLLQILGSAVNFSLHGVAVDRHTPPKTGRSLLCADCSNNANGLVVHGHNPSQAETQ